MHRLYELIADILGVNLVQIDREDNLFDDWGIDVQEKDVLDEEFAQAFDVPIDEVEESKPKTVEDYARLAGL